MLRTSLRPGYRLCLESNPPGLGLVGELCPRTPILKTLSRGLLCSETTSGREEWELRLLWNGLLEEA